MATGTLAKIMEHQAVAEALAALPDDASAVVFSDSRTAPVSFRNVHRSACRHARDGS